MTTGVWKSRGKSFSLVIAGLVIAFSAAAVAKDFDVNDGLVAYVAGDYAEAIDRLFPLAKAGDALAELVLGKTFLEPLNARRDCGSSKYWLERSAESGNAQAAFELGYVYEAGTCGTADPLIAIEWYLKAFDRGWAPAAKEIGRLYLSEVNSFERKKQARRWFLEGVKSFDWNCAMYLGKLYSDGLGVEQDFERAFIWYDVAFLMAPEYADDREAAMLARDAVREHLTLPEIGAGLAQANATLRLVIERLPIPAGVPIETASAQVPARGANLE